MEFCQRLYQLRREAGLSQEALAHQLGVSRQAVQKWESGASRPDLDNLTALAQCFSVSLDYLVTGEVLPPLMQESAPPPDAASGRPAWPIWYEYKSRRTLWGLPLVHIKLGVGLQRASGIIAIGNVATGLVALGCISVGLLSLGSLSLGLLAIGAICGGTLALGGLAVGLVALGGLAVGLLAIGGCAIGVYTVGAASIGAKAALGAAAIGPVAIGTSPRGDQVFFTPIAQAQLPALRAALDQACRGVPHWVSDLFYFLASRL